MFLTSIIDFLSELPQDGIIRNGFDAAMPYRGYNHCIGFEPARDVKVSTMLEIAKECLEKTFHGYKDITALRTFEPTSICYLAEYGKTVSHPIDSLDLQRWKEDATRTLE